MNEETKDTRMLPVVAWLCEWMADKRGGVYSGLSKTSLEGLRRSQGEDVLIVSDEPLCRLTDAQARLAEKDARIAQLAAHARGKNKALANALKEIERFDADFKRLGEQYVQALHQITTLRAQLEKLQAAPAERGVFVPYDLLVRVLEPVTSEQYINSKHELLALMREFESLNPSPATADSDVREVK